jgi:hypothetical protein
MNWIDGAMTEEWRPVWVQRIDREIAGYEKERAQHRTMFDEYTKKLEELRAKRKEWTDGKNAYGD